jgi:predicted dehydrogenase
MISIGVIGYGYWGPNLVRNFAELPGVRVGAVSDPRPERLVQVCARYPDISTTTNASAILSDTGLDAVAIATPVSTHFDLASQALRAGKHVLVAKPLAATVAQGEQLIDEASHRGLILMVDHTFVYTGAVRKMKELIDAGRLGQLYYYDSVRINLGLFQHDVNVLWDLAAHDLSIMDYVLPGKPRAVSALGIAHVPRQAEDVAYLTYFFDDNLIAHFHVNWLAPVKIRRTLIGGSAQMIVYDDLEPSEKIRVYDRGITVGNDSERIHQMLIGYRIGDVWAPQLDLTEALHTEVRHFVHCIETRERPVTDGEAGLRVVRLLAAASTSLKLAGRVVDPDTIEPRTA